MTTNTDRAIALVGNLIAHNIDRVPDDQVIEFTKNEIHDLLEEGAMFEHPQGPQESRLLELIALLGFTATTSVWTIEQSVFGLVDSYDLFND